MQVRHASLKDADAIAAVHVRSWEAATAGWSQKHGLLSGRCNDEPIYGVSASARARTRECSWRRLNRTL